MFKPTWATGVHFAIRTDIKVALQTLARKRTRERGNKVGLAGIFTEAALFLLEHEGIPVGEEPGPRPVRKPAKSVARRKMAAHA